MSSDLARQTRNAQGAQAKTAEKVAALTKTIQGTRNGIAAALGERIGPDRFLRAAVTTLRTTPKLADCSAESILGGLFVAAQLGLEIGGPRGLVYLVPYGKEATLVVGYRGFVDLFYRAGARSVEWFLVREGDHFRIASDAVHGFGYQWAPPDGQPDDSRPWTGAVAQVVTASGAIVWEFMSRDQIEARSTNTPIWRQWPEEMALKTVLRRLVKRAPASVELAQAVEADETVQRQVEGLAEPIAEHVPVEGPKPAAPKPRPAATPVVVEPDPVDPEREPDPEPVPDQGGQPGDETPEQYEARTRAEYDDWLAAQGEQGDTDR